MFEEEEEIVMEWKKSLVAVSTALALAVPLSAYSGEYDDFEDSHPLRIVAYPVHAVGYAMEWLITRPIHTLVSQPDLQPVFGHYDHDFSFSGRPSGMLPTGTINTPPPPPVPVMSEADLDTIHQAAEDASAAAERAKRAAEAAERAAERSSKAFDSSLYK